MIRYILLVAAAMILCSCGIQKRITKENKQLDIAYRALDSLNKEFIVHTLNKEVKIINDKSRIVMTKYTSPDSTGKQSIDYTVVMEKDIEHRRAETMETQTEENVHRVKDEVAIDKSTVQATEKVDDAPVVKTVKNVKWIVAMLLIAFIIYLIKKAAF